MFIIIKYGKSNSELIDHLVEVLLHLLQHGALGKAVTAVLLCHSLDNRSDGCEENNHILLRLPDPATHLQLLDPRDLVSCHLGYQRNKPGHQAHLGRVALSHLVRSGCAFTQIQD